MGQLASSNWKERLAGMESLMDKIKVTEPKDFQSQVLVGIILKKPGLKDTNFQVVVESSICIYRHLAYVRKRESCK